MTGFGVRTHKLYIMRPDAYISGPNLSINPFHYQYIMYIRSIFVVVALLVTLRPAGAQALLIDSLQQTLSRNDLSPRDHVVTMALLGRAHCRTDAAEGLGIAQDAVKHSWKLKDAATTSFAYSILAMLRYYNGDGEASVYAALDSTFYYARQSRQKRPLGIAWFRKGWIQSIQGKFQEAVSSYMTALKNLEGTNSHDYESSIYYALAEAHGNWRDYPQQDKYARLSLEAGKKVAHLITSRRPTRQWPTTI